MITLVLLSAQVSKAQIKADNLILSASSEYTKFDGNVHT
jgi:hypothetical protein